MKTPILTTFTFLFLSHSVWASPIASGTGVVPLENGLRPEASDLIFNGKRLAPHQALELLNSGYDISDIDPDPSTDLWKPDGKHPELAADDVITVKPGDQVKYLKVQASPIETHRFIVQHQASDGTERLYQAVVGKRLQTFLLRRNLLRKLGYYTPPSKWISNMRVDFGTSISKINFVEKKPTGLIFRAFGDSEFITNFEDKESSYWDFQDVLLLPSKIDIRDLSLGAIRPSLTQGRRLINALIVPYNLVDVVESVNGFRWHSAQIKSNALYLPIKDYEVFATTLSDAKWITKKILKLSREDYKEIVSGIGYPPDVQALLVEKLISRRNELKRVLNLKGHDIPFNAMVSSGSNLQNGVLLEGEYAGIAGRMAMDELPSKITGTELRSLFKSKLISTTISELMQRVNRDLKSDLEGEIFEKQKELFLDDFVSLVTTGKPVDRDFGVWSTPYAQGQLIASREVVAGSYLGTDNRVQLVDTIGYGVDTGMYFGTFGLRPEQSLDARARVFYYRRYSHLKPVTSIKIALKQPYKNILVPVLKGEWADTIDPAAFEKPEDENQSDQSARLYGMAKLLKENLGPGESLIISDNLGTGANIRYGYSLSERLQAQAALDASMTTLSRLHIQRVGDRLNVYKDKGNMKSLQLVINLRAEIEILNLNVKFSKAKARTEFYSVNLEEDTEKNPDLQLGLAAVRDLLLNNSVSRIKSYQDPTRLAHKLSESQRQLKFLVWNSFKLKNYDNLILQRADDDQPEYFTRRLIGKRSGVDYQTLGVDIINEILESVLDQDIQVTNANSGDPGETLFGKSTARYTVFEAELNESDEYLEKYVEITYRWKGWTADRDYLEGIVRDLNDRFEFQFYHPEAFKLIKEAELYNMHLYIRVYDWGVDHAVALTEGQFHKLLKDHRVSNSVYRRRFEILKKWEKLQRWLGIYIKRGDKKKIADITVHMVSLLETSLDHYGLIKAVGGDKNLHIQPILTGFMRGEDGKMAERPVEGNEIGEVGSERQFGPITTTQRELGMTEGEFFVYWMLRRI